MEQATSRLEQLLDERQKRLSRQLSERDAAATAATDAALQQYWGSFPEGIGIVMRAANAADTAWAYRGDSPFMLTFIDLEDLMVRSRGCCELTGVPFSGETISGISKRPFVPSIDRIEPTGPYAPENVRLVCWAVNRALGRWGDAVFGKILVGFSVPTQAGLGYASSETERAFVRAILDEADGARALRESPVIRRTRSVATAEVVAQFAEQQKELDERERRQLRELNRQWQIARLAGLWSHYLDGINDVMKAAHTARKGHLYHGGHPFLVTRPELASLMIRSKGRCELSGVLFSGEQVAGWSKRPFIPSLDRIKPKEPYTFKNLRLVCWIVNRALGDWGDEVFLKIMLSAASRGHQPRGGRRSGCVNAAYAALKNLIKARYPKVSDSVDHLEQAPESKARRAGVEEELTAANARQDAEVVAAARILIEMIKQHAPGAAASIGVDLKDVAAANLRLADITASDTGVKVERGTFIGDIDIRGVRAGVPSKDD